MDSINPIKQKRNGARPLLIQQLGGKCIQCNGIIDLELDHVIPISKGGTDSIENIQILCNDCHTKKHANEKNTPERNVLQGLVKTFKLNSTDTRNGKRTAQVMLYETLRERIKNIPNETDFWFIATTYANGNRIQETCNLTYADFEWTDEFLYIHSGVLKKRKNKKTGIAPIPKRNNPIDRKLESWITEPIILFIEAKRGSPNDTNKVWKKTKRTAQSYIDKYLSITSHSLRHNRVTHLMIKFEYSMRDLLEYFKIEPKTIAEWSVRYGHLERSYLEEKFKKMRMVKN